MPPEVLVIGVLFVLWRMWPGRQPSMAELRTRMFFSNLFELVWKLFWWGGFALIARVELRVCAPERAKQLGEVWERVTPYAPSVLESRASKAP